MATDPRNHWPEGTIIRLPDDPVVPDMPHLFVTIPTEPRPKVGRNGGRALTPPLVTTEANAMSCNSDPGGSRTHDLRIKRTSRLAAPDEPSAPVPSASDGKDGASCGAHTSEAVPKVGRNGGRGLKRKTPLTRTAMKRSTTPLPKVNVKRSKQRRQSYAKKLAAMKKGPGYKAAMERAGGRCEWIAKRAERRDYGAVLPIGDRCPETEGLEAHHRTYRRFTKELPEDFLILCERHHALIESTQHSSRRRGRLPRVA